MTFKISDGMLLGSQVLLDPDRVLTATDYDIKASYPDSTPTLKLDFTNNNNLDKRITFTRNSIGTYTGQSTHISTQNLASYSEAMDATNGTSYGWTKGNCTITATTAVAAPTGTNITNRYIFAETTATSPHYTYLNFAGSEIVSNYQTVITYSVYLKSGANQYVQISVGGTTSSTDYAGIVINLATGAVTQQVLKTSTILNSFTYAVTDAGNGWYRCSVTCNSRKFFLIGTLGNTATHVEDTVSYGFLSYTGNAANTFYLCGAQVEYGTQPTAYNPTTLTQPFINKSMRTIKTAAVNTPRFEYNAITGESKGLLIEESKTNSTTYSSDYTNAAWGKQGVTALTSNVVIAPDGTYAQSLTENSVAATQHRIVKSATLTATTYTISVYAKKGYGSRYFSLNADTFLSYGYRAIFDLSTGTLVTSIPGQGTETYTITPVGDGWYRLSITFLGKAAAGSWYMELNNYPASASGVSYDGDGVSSVYLWGAQLEIGYYTTSYIPTTSATVTRQADDARISGSNLTTLFNNSAGTAFVEVIRPSDYGTGNNKIMFDFKDSTNTLDNNKVIRAFIAPVYSHAVVGQINDNTVTTVYSQSTSTVSSYMTLGVSKKFAFAWDFSGTANVSLNGSINTDVNISTASQITVNALRLGGYVNATAPTTASGTMYIKKFMYYNTRLSNAQLQVLTA